MAVNHLIGNVTGQVNTIVFSLFSAEQIEQRFFVSREAENEKKCR